MDELLQGRVAVVTGGAAGIGGGISRALAAEGAHVVVNDIDEALLAAALADIAAAGGTATPVHGDIREEATVATLAEVATTIGSGAVDVLVNNVGDYRPGGRFLRSTPADWKTLYDRNLGHVFACTHALAGGMAERGSGSIVNVSTVDSRTLRPTRHPSPKKSLVERTATTACLPCSEMTLICTWPLSI